MKRVFLSLTAMLLACAGVFFTDYAQAKPLKLRLASVTTTTDHLGLGLTRFKELVEKKSGKSMKVQLFMNAQLGSDRVIAEAVQKGTLDMALISQGNLSLFCSDFLIFELPHYINPTAENRAKLYASLDRGELGQYLRKLLNKVGFEPLFYPETGIRQHIFGSKKVTDVAGLKNVKMRITDSVVELENCKALSIYPVAMGFGEVLTAMRQGTVDAFGLPLASLATMNRDAEIAKYALLTNYLYYMSPVVINLKRLRSLTPDQQKILREAAQEAVDFERKELDRQEAAAREQLVREGMQIFELSPEELKKFDDLIRPVWDKFNDKISKETFEVVARALQ